MNKTRWSIKQLALLLSIVLIATVTAGGSLAYIFTQTQGLTNTFEPTKVTCQINDEMSNDKTVKTNATVENTGNVDAYIRAALVFTWRSPDGNIAPVSVDASACDLSIGNDWFEKDGYYYYKTVVPATDPENTSTTALIVSCSVKDSVEIPEGYGLCVEIIADAIQADGVNAADEKVVTTVWPVSVDEDGNLKAN